MAYEKQEWKCGDTITADKLNHMEGGIANASEGGSCDCGFSCNETYASLFSGSVTTEGKDEYNPANASVDMLRTFAENEIPTSLKVTFNGAEYICPAYGEYTDQKNFGASSQYDQTSDREVWDWSEYPFSISIIANYVGLVLSTENNGTYQLQIEYPSVEAEVSDCFKLAVQKAVGIPLVVDITSTYDESTSTYSYSFNKTNAEIYEAANNNRQIIMKFGDSYLTPLYIKYEGGCGGGAYRFILLGWQESSNEYKPWIFNGQGADNFATASAL